MWAFLGLPDAWLPTFYQAVLAPVRFLWHVWPQYKTHYAQVEQSSDLTATTSSLSGLLLVLAQAVASMAADFAVPASVVACASALLGWAAVDKTIGLSNGEPQSAIDLGNGGVLGCFCV